MKLRTPITCLALGLCGFPIVGVVLQARELDALRDEGRRLQQQLNDLQQEQGDRTSLMPVQKPATRSPSPELLRLRSEVSQLTRRERELAGVPVENERLRMQLASSRTNAAIALPPGYIRKSEARNLGYTAPEATLETILWAIRNRDLTNLLAGFTPEIAEDLQRTLQRDGKSQEEFFKEAELVPGFNVLERVAKDDSTIELRIEIMPGSGDQARPVRFRLLNGQWKMDSR